MNCPFCEIVKDSSKGEIFDEDEHCLAIVPIKIEADGHLLVIPKTHYEDIFVIDEVVLERVFRFVQKTCRKLKAEYGVDGVNILNANGVLAQQSVSHFHIHLIPRFKHDGIDAWPIFPGGKNIYR